MNTEEKEICLNVIPFHQPSPVKNKGGDCFCCAFTAGMHHLFPERKITFDEMFKCFMGETINGNPCVNNAWLYYETTFKKLKVKGYSLEFLSNIVLPDYSNTNTWNYDFYRFNNHHKFFDTVFDLLSCGWLLFFSIDNDGNGPIKIIDNKKYKNTINHLILVDGIKSQWDNIDGMVGCRAYNYYIHVVCSSKGTYWIKLDDFIDKHGAAAWWQFRRLEL